MGKTPIIKQNLREAIVARDRATHRPSIDVRMVRIADIVVKNRFRQEMGDIAGLAASIQENGLINPITLLPDLTLIAGGRRLAAFEMLQKEMIAARIIESLLDAETALRIERDENTQRKDFTPFELKAILEALLPEAEKAAKERMMAGKKNNQPSGRRPQGQPEVTEPSGRRPQGQPEVTKPSGRRPQGSEKGRALDHIAAIAGTSGKTLQRIKNITEKGTPQLMEAISRGEVSVTEADLIVRGKTPPKAQSDQPVRVCFETTVKLNDGRFVKICVNSDTATIAKHELEEAFSKALESINGDF